MEIKASLHCNNSPEEMRELLARATGATNDTQAAQRGEILTLMHNLELKIGALRASDNDEKFFDKIDSKLRGMLDSVDDTPHTRSAYSQPRRGAF